MNPPSVLQLITCAVCACVVSSSAVLSREIVCHAVRAHVLSKSRQINAERTIVISEIMFDPLSTDSISGAEYVEFYNASSDSIHLTGWKLFDGTGKAQATISGASAIAKPGAYFVIASDSSVLQRFGYLRDSGNVFVAGSSSLGLNSTGDDVVLRDATGQTLDSVHYSSSWHRSDVIDAKGISLERISIAGATNDFRNWSSSVDMLGGTPGRVNSQSITVDISDASISVTPSTISPDGDGRQDFARIAYSLPAKCSRIVVTVFDRYGRVIARPVNNELSGSTGERIWNGADDTGQYLPVGFYVVRIDGYDEGGKGLMSAQTTVVVARKL